MSRLTKRNLIFALALGIAPLAIAHADGTTPPPPASPSSVTGGSPEPTSPKVVELVLSLLHLA
jgi:hypothetical protein